MSTDIQPTKKAIPLLEAGDRLSQSEFLRRYNAMPKCEHAELVEGVVYMASPVAAETHGEPHFSLIGWLFQYRARTPAVYGGDNSTLLLDVDNAPQPDAYLRLGTERSGQSRIEDGYVVGAPELVAEVSASTASYDLHDKLHAYRRNGVCEYLVWRTWDQEVDWFLLQDGVFQPQQSDKGIYRSQSFPGLWLDTRALLANDMASVLDCLQQGMESSDYKVFAESK